MSIINVLSKDVAELIAAGEVIERPSSVIKELVENAIDSGANHITIEIKSGGSTYMRIVDNGCGISSEDVPKAFLRHATSKVITKQDLDNIHTLGFRGEALASIAAVSRVELITKTLGEPFGTHFVIDGGQPRFYEKTGCPEGTTIIVRDLFYNVPARQKFLKKDVTEANFVSSIIKKIALSHPGISFKLIRDNRMEFSLPGDGKLYSVMYAIYGKVLAEDMIPVDYTEGGITVSGFTVKPLFARTNRSFQNFFVNDRYVHSNTCTMALDEAYKNVIMTGKFPAGVLNIYAPPIIVDVNVHPTKAEVRFSDEKLVFNALFFAVKNALMKSGEVFEFQFGNEGKSNSSSKWLEGDRSKPSAKFEQMQMGGINTNADAFFKTKEVKMNELNMVSLSSIENGIDERDRDISLDMHISNTISDDIKKIFEDQDKEHREESEKVGASPVAEEKPKALDKKEKKEKKKDIAEEKPIAEEVKTPIQNVVEKDDEVVPEKREDTLPEDAFEDEYFGGEGYFINESEEVKSYFQLDTSEVQTITEESAEAKRKREKREQREISIRLLKEQNAKAQQEEKERNLDDEIRLAEERLKASIEQENALNNGEAPKDIVEEKLVEEKVVEEKPKEESAESKQRKNDNDTIARILKKLADEEAAKAAEKEATKLADEKQENGVENSEELPNNLLYYGMLVPVVSEYKSLQGVEIKCENNDVIMVYPHMNNYESRDGYTFPTNLLCIQAGVPDKINEPDFETPNEVQESVDEVAETANEVQENADEVAETVEQVDTISDEVEGIPDENKDKTEEITNISESSIYEEPVTEDETDDGEFKFITEESFEEKKDEPKENFDIANIYDEVAEPISEPIVEDEYPEMETSDESEIRLVGEAFANYIIIEVKDSLYLIDKHAAHERIIFEQLKEKHTKIDSQLVIGAKEITLAPDEIAILQSNIDVLDGLGFKLDFSGSPCVVPIEIPVILADYDMEEIILEIARNIESNKNDPQTKLVDDIFHTMACKAAIKANDKTDAIELKALAVEVFNNPKIRYCPHGRPVMFALDKKHIERQFKRV